MAVPLGHGSVAFGDFAPWTAMIRPKLDARYTASFVDLSRVRMRDFDAVVPLQLVHYSALAEFPELRGRKFFHPSPEVVSLCDDKMKLAQFLIAQGFGQYVPGLRPCGPPYPYVLKKRMGWWGMHCRIVNGPEDERDFNLSGDEWFAQDFVPGHIEFATHILRTGGQIRYASTVAHQMAKASSVLGARDTSLHSRLLPGCKYLDRFSEILAKLDYEGTACFDYKVIDHRPAIFEINPRFGGSLSLDITAYLDAYFDCLAPATLSLHLKSVPIRMRRRWRALRAGRGRCR
jgi:ATP-grasp domain